MNDSDPSEYSWASNIFGRGKRKKGNGSKKNMETAVVIQPCKHVQYENSIHLGWWMWDVMLCVGRNTRVRDKVGYTGR